MITRIVKMVFNPQEIQEFKEIFKTAQPFILSMKGCNSVYLFSDCKQGNILFTISKWDSEEDLNAYRNSALFEKTWANTKVLFADKPMAWSLTEFDPSSL
jgi:heme-degrading monooxygenase HmoA